MTTRLSIPEAALRERLLELRAKASPLPWEYFSAQIVESARPHMRIFFLPSNHYESDTSKPSASLVLTLVNNLDAILAALTPAAPGLLEAAADLSDVAGEGSEDLPDNTPVRVSIGSRSIVMCELRHFRRLSAAVANAEATPVPPGSGTGWLPIETADRAARILAWETDDCEAVFAKHDGRCWRHDPGGWMVRTEMWQPLPSPPDVAEDGR